MADLSRAERLQARFSAILDGVRTVHGEDKAFLAEQAADLMMIKHVIYEALIAVSNGAPVDQCLADVDGVLQGVNRTSCKYLGVDQQEIFNITSSFHQVIEDLCNSKG